MVTACLKTLKKLQHGTKKQPNKGIPKLNMD